jgi:hypothetical protein
MITNRAAFDGYEISPKFRQTMEERVVRLERDAALDEAKVMMLDDAEHVRRQLRLVATQRAEALRMGIFLDRVETRQSRPEVAR